MRHRRAVPRIMKSCRLLDSFWDDGLADRAATRRRLMEISEDGTETSVATITLWQPPHRFVMIWQVNARGKPDATKTLEVDVRFTADGYNATMVERLHHNIENLGAEAGASIRRDVDGGWPGLAGADVSAAQHAGDAA